VARICVNFRRNTTTGKLDIVIRHETDGSPIERERMHRAVVEKFIGQRIDADEMGELVIEPNNT